MQVVIAGASGFLGTHLTSALHEHGHTVTQLVRRPARSAEESQWDPYAGEVDGEVIAASDVVVNLSGRPIAGNPHSSAWARDVLESRVTTTRLLAETIAAAAQPPAYLASNGISFYGDRGAEPLTEESGTYGDAFLTRVTLAWQEATTPASDAGARVCVLRTAPVIDRRNPPLKQLLLPFKLGLGARLGNGRQYSPMISLRDWLGAVLFLAEHDDVSGPVNLCCPETPTNREYTDALADAVGRRARLAAPAAVLKRAAGSMSPELLGSINVRPRVLLDAGYHFTDSDVRDVVAAALA
jgi:uncharacterized protein